MLQQQQIKKRKSHFRPFSFSILPIAADHTYKSIRMRKEKKTIQNCIHTTNDCAVRCTHNEYATANGEASNHHAFLSHCVVRRTLGKYRRQIACACALCRAHIVYLRLSNSVSADKQQNKSAERNVRHEK